MRLRKRLYAVRITHIYLLTSPLFFKLSLQSSFYPSAPSIELAIVSHWIINERIVPIERIHQPGWVELWFKQVEYLKFFLQCLYLEVVSLFSILSLSLWF